MHEYFRPFLSAMTMVRVPGSCGAAAASPVGQHKTDICRQHKHCVGAPEQQNPGGSSCAPSRSIAIMNAFPRSLSTKLTGGSAGSVQARDAWGSQDARDFLAAASVESTCYDLQHGRTGSGCREAGQKQADTGTVPRARHHRRSPAPQTTPDECLLAEAVCAFVRCALRLCHANASLLTLKPYRHDRGEGLLSNVSCRAL